MTDRSWSSSSTKPDVPRRPPRLGRRLFGDSRWFVFVFSKTLHLVSNCALNMACEILQLELGNMNLRLFGSPGKFYGQAQAHSVTLSVGIYHESATESETEFKNFVSDSVSDSVSD
ncbi:hypothetical protein Syun_020971 [Stephania yunnanensis]|uniref:Uncharacterized protein n=1 Tax=Stephania yunnanensis TaxID=152371 RepID=A0AAP0NQ80_9MAGN